MHFPSNLAKTSAFFSLRLQIEHYKQQILFWCGLWTQTFQTAVIWSLKLTSNLAQNWRCCYSRGHSWSPGWPSSIFLAFRSFWDNCKCLGIIHFKIKMSSLIFRTDVCPLPPRLKSKFHNSSVSRKQLMKIIRKCQNWNTYPNFIKYHITKI